MKKHTRATPAGVPRSRSKLTRRERAIEPYTLHGIPLKRWFVARPHFAKLDRFRRPLTPPA